MPGPRAGDRLRSCCSYDVRRGAVSCVLPIATARWEGSCVHTSRHASLSRLFAVHYVTSLDTPTPRRRCLLPSPQSVKRLITQLQRLYPTDPSRSVDFDPVPDPGKGALVRVCSFGWRPQSVA